MLGARARGAAPSSRASAPVELEPAAPRSARQQLPLFGGPIPPPREMRAELTALDPDALTPLEALKRLAEWKMPASDTRWPNLPRGAAISTVM